MPSSLATRRLLHPPSRLTHSLRPVSTHYHPSIQQAYHNIQAHDHGHAGVHAFVALNPPHSAAYPAPDPTDAHPLAGLPIAIKDNFCTSDLPTTACSSILKDFISPYSSTPTNLLSAAGAHVIGKTSCDEFGMGSHNVNLPSKLSPPVNPFWPSSGSSEGSNHGQNGGMGSLAWKEREQRSCGGSSGGSAAAVASGMAWAALGTDTGGSVRLPASYCGVVGLKPSYGLISRHGLISYADTLDTVGILAKKVDDVKRVFDVISKPDAKDPTCSSPAIRASSAAITSAALSALPGLAHGRLDGLRIGVPIEAFPSETHDALTSESEGSATSLDLALRTLQTLGATLHSVSTPLAPHALSAYYVIASAEAASNLSRFDGVRFGSRSQVGDGEGYQATRGAGFGNEVKKRILVGGYALSAEAYNSYYLPSRLLRKHLTRSYVDLFRHAHPWISSTSTAEASNLGIDILIQPSSISSAPLLSSLTNPCTDMNPESGSDTAASTVAATSPYVQDVLTVPASLTGFPAMSLPVRRWRRDGKRGKLEECWPIGVGMVGFWGGEALMFEVARVLEQALAADGARIEGESQEDI